MSIRLTTVKETRRLTLIGWLVVVLTCVALFFVWLVTIHKFLAVNQPLETNILVVEGYVPDSVLDSIAQLKNESLLIVCAGLPIDKGFLCPGYSSYAAYNANVLITKGVDSLRIISAPARQTDKDRTYTTALAAKEKLKSLGYTSGKLNVVCAGTHARRSRLLYRKALKPEWQIGVLSISGNYYPEPWWHTSEGARAVVYEMFAYLYCAIFYTL